MYALEISLKLGFHALERSLPHTAGFSENSSFTASSPGSHMDSRMNGLRRRISGPLSTSTTGTTERAIPTNPSKEPAHPYPSVSKSSKEARGRNAPKVLRRSEAADSADAAYFS